jgi:oxaloacetate decarboxylase (Na+ extruding) subunit alpha
LKPELESLRKECAEWIEQEEDVLSYAQFPKVAVDFFKERAAKKYGVDGKHADAANAIHPV